MSCFLCGGNFDQNSLSLSDLTFNFKIKIAEILNEKSLEMPSDILLRKKKNSVVED